MATLPEYYFRIRENGAAVFRVDAENRHQRLELEQIAVLNIRNGEVKPQGARALSDEDRAAIDAWMAERRARLAARENETGQQILEQLNLAAQWAQSKASPEQLDGVSDALLLAIHDLRGVLVRKKADRLAEQADDS